MADGPSDFPGGALGLPRQIGRPAHNSTIPIAYHPQLIGTLMPSYVFRIITCLLFVQLAAANPHFTDCASRTGGNATFVLTSDADPTLFGEPLPLNAQVAAFSDRGICGGVGTWDGKNLVVAVWGDDAQTEKEDGLGNGEHLVFKVWDPATEMEFNSSNADIVVSYDTSKSLLSRDGSFADGAILHARSFDILAVVGEEFEDVPLADEELMLQTPFPNPAFASTTLQIFLPTAATVVLEAFDMLGRCVASIVSNRKLPSGKHSFPFDVAGLPSGVYLLRMKADGRMRSRTLHVVQD